jgi:nitroreductase
MSKTAVTIAPIHSLLADRWSTRAFDTAAEISNVELTSLIEAARWAPSANNGQPWRFVVAKRGQDLFGKLTETLAGFNKEWAPTASAFVVAIAEVEDSAGAARKSAEFDLGLAVSALTTQATADGWSTHQMGGFSASAIRELLELDSKLKPVVVIAVGKHSDTIEISEALQARESAPRTRLELNEILLNPDALA